MVSRTPRQLHNTHPTPGVTTEDARTAIASAVCFALLLVIALAGSVGVPGFAQRNPAANSLPHERQSQHVRHGASGDPVFAPPDRPATVALAPPQQASD